VTANPQATVKQLKADLRAAWDLGGMGERKFWPYRVWCQEVRLALRLPSRRERKTGQKIMEFVEAGRK
jgi:hypothetical protein